MKTNIFNLFIIYSSYFYSIAFCFFSKSTRWTNNHTNLNKLQITPPTPNNFTNRSRKSCVLLIKVPDLTKLITVTSPKITSSLN
jgi:hypothetical protein